MMLAARRSGTALLRGAASTLSNTSRAEATPTIWGALGAGSWSKVPPLSQRMFGAKADVPDNLIPEPKASPSSEVPTVFEQATGLERAEIEHPDLFKHNEVLRGQFGTKENPVMIESNFESRIVGCTGRAAPDDHDLYWLLVEKGDQYSCPLCGQVFQLSPL